MDILDSTTDGPGRDAAAKYPMDVETAREASETSEESEYSEDEEIYEGVGMRVVFKVGWLSARAVRKIR